ncbi:putative F-box protein [Raphanus sativus]|uniref:F-box protein At1g32420 n=1 Tax=Raphanus sativus TaxID=3726 RepID=A0A9W3DJY4_RAPSA|nr:putative F-box protein At1g32420 [Raphanus sativus]KAJ4903092.1 putative F-box protein [Raphanus sativus]
MPRNSSGVITIPLKLLVEIFEKLPTKSLARFRCVSHQWESIINNSIVIDSIVTRRLIQPPRRDPHFFFETCRYQPQHDHPPFTILSYHQVTDEEQHYHEEIIGEGYLIGFQYVRGLIGFWCSDNLQYFRIHNPTTRQSLFIPNIKRLPGSLFYLFGYDPFKNQYKVLCLTHNLQEQSLSCTVFVLGDVSKEWREIQCSIGFHFLFNQQVCINGAIYYKARDADGTHVLASFDVRHETFNHVQTPENLLAHYNHDVSSFVNYHGKLGCICPSSFVWNEMDMWVMHDAEKQEWSKIDTFVDMFQGLPSSDIRFAGVTNPGGEIVMVHKDYPSELALNVYYYDTKQNGLRRSEIQTTRPSETTRPSDQVTVRAVTDHVENIMSFGILDTMRRLSLL